MNVVAFHIRGREEGIQGRVKACLPVREFLFSPYPSQCLPTPPLLPEKALLAHQIKLDRGLSWLSAFAIECIHLAFYTHMYCVKR